MTIDIESMIAAHAAWRRGEPGGRRANLSGANLSGANLSRANLSGANLSGVMWPEPTIVLGPRGSRRDNLVYRIRSDAVHAGCWTGTLEKFARRVDGKYPEGTRHGDAYRRDIIYLKGERAAELEQEEMTA